MNRTSHLSGAVLGLSIFLGLSALGVLLARAAIEVREYERTVTAKGLSEREVAADVVIWPVTFTLTSNDLSELHGQLASDSRTVLEFLRSRGIEEAELSQSAPLITDRAAQAWNNTPGAEFRYVASRTVTLHSRRIDRVRAVMGELPDLLGRGIVLGGDPYQNRVQYLFEGLNGIKPSMVEEATRNARAVAQKFAQDSGSMLGKIRRASQGQFSIEDRDSNNPHLKKVRVVSTVEYYLSD